MRKIVQTIIVLFLAFTSFAQSPLDKALNDISTDLASKLSQKNKKRVVVLFINTITKEPTVAGKYFADIISGNIVNNVGNFKVFDRENLNGIVETKKLIAEGYLNVDKTKEIGKLLSVDAIIIGNYTMLSNSIKLTIKALDSSDGFVFAQSTQDLPFNADAGALLGINITNNAGTENMNRGFNDRPLNSNESFNNPSTVNPKCKEKNTGDYCFSNTTSLKIRVHMGSSVGELTLSPGQTQCKYNLSAEEYNYKIYDERYAGSIAFGQILVEQCKSKTFVIK
jgi:Curli production assembly/transport component CsgG